MRWLVERARDQFEDVGANHVTVVAGALVFHQTEWPMDSPVYVLAAGQWLTVVPDEEDAK